MILIVETTTGRLKPDGVAPQLPRGGLDTVIVQFVTNGVAALLPEGAPIALKLYSPSDLNNPLVQLGAFAALPADLAYKGSLNTVSGGLAYLERATLIAKISYGNPNVDTANFHVVYGAAGSGTGAPPVQLVITQPSGPVNYVQAIGSITGKATLNQVDGFWRVKSPGNLLGLQLAAQDAPTGADLIVEVIKNGLATGKTGKLTAAAKNEESIFAGGPVALAIGDIVQFKPTQIGSGKPGSYLAVAGVVQLA
jgi:hypothetical protein